MRISVGSVAGLPSPGRVWRSSVIGVAARHASSSSFPSIETGDARCAAEAAGTGAASCAPLIRWVGSVCCAESDKVESAPVASAATTARGLKMKYIGEGQRGVLEVSEDSLASVGRPVPYVGLNAEIRRGGASSAFSSRCAAMADTGQSRHIRVQPRHIWGRVWVTWGVTRGPEREYGRGFARLPLK